MFSVEFWFDSGVNTTQYGGFTDEEILDLGPPVWVLVEIMRNEFSPKYGKKEIQF